MNAPIKPEDAFWAGAIVVLYAVVFIGLLSAVVKQERRNKDLQFPYLLDRTEWWKQIQESFSRKK